MKKMRRLIPAFAMLLVAATMLSTASFAWFTISTEAEAVGMSVKATASSSLLITDGVESADWLAATGSVDVSEQNITTSLTPATHDSSYTNGLKTIGDASKVNPATGAYEATTWTTTNKGTHYVEYIVYIGTTGEAMTNKFLSVEVSAAKLKYVLHNAVTVDFLVNGNYGGSINLEQVDATATTTTNGSYKMDIAKGLTIPVSVKVDDTTGNSVITEEYVTITMRVYFDGDLVQTEAVENADGTTTPAEYYVQNTAATTQAIGFAVNFAASDSAFTTNTNANIYDATPSTPAQGQ